MGDAARRRVRLILALLGATVAITPGAAGCAHGDRPVASFVEHSAAAGTAPSPSRSPSPSPSAEPTAFPVPGQPYRIVTHLCPDLDIGPVVGMVGTDRTDTSLTGVLDFGPKGARVVCDQGVTGVAGGRKLSGSVTMDTDTWVDAADAPADFERARKVEIDGELPPRPDDPPLQSGALTLGFVQQAFAIYRPDGKGAYAREYSLVVRDHNVVVTFMVHVNNEATPQPFPYEAQTFRQAVQRSLQASLANLRR
jgi:hypothetical protein